MVGERTSELWQPKPGFASWVPVWLGLGNKTGKTVKTKIIFPQNDDVPLILTKCCEFQGTSRYYIVTGFVSEHFTNKFNNNIRWLGRQCFLIMLYLNP